MPVVNRPADARIKTNWLKGMSGIEHLPVDRHLKNHSHNRVESSGADLQKCHSMQAQASLSKYRPGFRRWQYHEVGSRGTLPRDWRQNWRTHTRGYIIVFCGV